jgi:hypothetical protein
MEFGVDWSERKNHPGYSTQMHGLHRIHSCTKERISRVCMRNTEQGDQGSKCPCYFSATSGFKYPLQYRLRDGAAPVPEYPAWIFHVSLDTVWQHHNSLSCLRFCSVICIGCVRAVLGDR